MRYKMFNLLSAYHKIEDVIHRLHSMENSIDGILYNNLKHTYWDFTVIVIENSKNLYSPNRVSPRIVKTLLNLLLLSNVSFKKIRRNSIFI